MGVGTVVPGRTGRPVARRRELSMTDDALAIAGRRDTSCYRARVIGTGEADLTAVAVAFNDSINGRDVDGLAGLMTDDHTFVDTEGGSVAGRRDCLDAWRGFFDSFPDYRNV